MKTLLSILFIVGLSTDTFAEEAAVNSGGPADDRGCALTTVTHAWDFADGDHGFTRALCDADAEPAWEYGYVFGEYCFGTILAGDYPLNTGDSLISPLFVVDESAFMVQIRHFYEAQNGLDGGNLMVNGIIVAPQAGYPAVLNFQPKCVAFEPAFSGTDQTGFINSYFDLSSFMDESIRLRFEFGSNDWNNYLGWYIAAVYVGDDEVSADGKTWGQVKSVYR